MNKKLTISKLDAVKRQLETAICLYFSNGDPVSIHTLTAAAYNIVRDVNKRRGGPPLLIKQEILNYVKEGYEKEVRDKINAAENFFKHAERDHEQTLDFEPDLSEMLILEACSVYYKLSGEFPPLFKLFQGWYIANHQSMFNFPEDQQQIISKTKQDVLQLGREGYLNTILPLLLMKLNT
ncbi:MAG: hypothetical protein M0Z70_06105 [Nitrospiraceae bacterium]|nr:hypothetical protein [Nitrospiraceae bacterium]